MTNSILSKDTDIHFPHFMVIKASAGSGKTYALSRRFVQFILSDKVNHNNLRNILAITFSNNAAKEMRGRILKCLKELYFSDDKTINDFSALISTDLDKIPGKAGRAIDEIFDNYSDFLIKTIDSFTTSLFKASAIDFGYNPEFEILLNNDPLMEYSFNLFLKEVKVGSQAAATLEDVVEIIREQKSGDSSFLWDPASDILEKVKGLYIKLASTGKTVEIADYSDKIKNKCDEIRNKCDEIESKINQYELVRSGASSYPKILDAVRRGGFANLIGSGLKASPVKIPDKKTNKQAYYDEIAALWADAGELIRDYTSMHSRSYFAPYLKVYNEFSEKIETTKRQQGRIFIGDINRYLAGNLKSEVVPDIYFRIGETIYHYLIDEFQDTSPIQWDNLFPLIENSLAQSGSLFVVGDTKQAIYGFRNADYKIMKKCENENIFLSAKHVVGELQTNHRSHKKILEFNEKVFKENAVSKYPEPAKRSGLCDYIQSAKPDAKDGYVEAVILQRDDENPPEKGKLFETIQDLTSRGYTHNDITILTQKNESVITVTKWLNETGIDFVSMSSLDVRMRKVTGEIISLINFLNSPIDDLAFTAFIIGETFSKMLSLEDMGDKIPKIHDFLISRRAKYPLYKAFQKEFDGLWAKFFDELFKLAGYLPLYEMVNEIIKRFRLFETKKDEEAALIKILEAVKDFESSGFNSLKDFIEFFETKYSSSLWDIALPTSVNAVKVMTIHKAKGLGFPVVIAILYGQRGKGFDYIEEDMGDSINFLKINDKIASTNSDLKSLYEEAKANETVNKLNSLYVGFTRAEDELYVIGVKRDKEKFPFELLPQDGFLPSDNKPKDIKARTTSTQSKLTLLYDTKRTHISSPSDELGSMEERRRGEFIHRILSYIDYIEGDFDDKLQGIIKAVKGEMRVDYPQDDTMRLIKNVINNQALNEFFVRKPGRAVKKEMEIVDNGGRLYRVDRLIQDDNKLTVIDFKTGVDKDTQEKYSFQVKNYLKILGDIYPGKRLNGIVAYIDYHSIKTIGVY